MVPIVVFLFVLANGYASEEFNDMNVVCPVIGVQCVSLTQFVICTLGADKIVSPPVYNCPNNYVCDDSRSSPCYQIDPKQTNEDLKRQIKAETLKLKTKKKLRTSPKSSWETLSYDVETPIFTCTSDGYFPDPANCKNYYLCYRASNGWHAILNKCPYGQTFGENRCSYRTCNNQPRIKVHKPAFVCLKSGKFPDKSDCQNYFICDPNESGVLYSRVHRCPNEFHFDRLIGTCVSRYHKPQCDRKYERNFYFTWSYNFNKVNDEIVMKVAE